MNKKINFGIVSLVVSVSLVIVLIASGLLGGKERKIGVVMMDDLVYEYTGMKDATKTFTSKVEEWNLELDTLKKQLDFYYKEIVMDSINEDYSKLDKDTKKFVIIRNSYFQIREKLDERIQEKDQEMTIAIINQLRQWIKEYAVLHGYDLLIMNTKQQEVVGYSDKELDVTADLLEYANLKYEDEK